MNDLVTWLRAQVAEDERIARDAERFWHGVRIESATRAEEDHARRHTPARVLAEVEAKRRIVGLVDLDFNEDGEPICLGGFGEAYWDVVRLLALPYANREGYRVEWRP